MAVSALGHGHPALTSAIADQAAAVIHVSNLYAAPPVVALAEGLTRRTGMDRAFFCNSGAEAIEAALKLARRYFQVVRGESRFRFVAAEKSFHGRSFGALSVTGQPKYWEGFEPLVPGARFVPYGDVAALEAAVDQETAAILLEPIQGEGGVVIPPPGYLAAARAIADRAGCLLIFDEIQTGFGRTGTFLASAHEGVRPDVLTLAKGIAGGLPLGAMLHTEAVAEAFVPGSHMSTFGGNPVCCAAALVVLGLVGEEGFLALVREKGAALMEALNEGLASVAGVQEVRGRGLLVGISLDRPAGPFVSALYERGVLATVAGGTVLRLSPPLVIADREIEHGVREVVDVVTSLMDG